MEPETVFVAVGPYCWGRAKNPRLAWKYARENMPGPDYVKSNTAEFVVYQVTVPFELSLVTGEISAQRVTEIERHHSRVK